VLIFREKEEKTMSDYGEAPESLTLEAYPISDVNLLFMGHAIFTVENSNGSHYTFQISRAKKEDSPLFVSMLTGPDNVFNYTYLGLWDEQFNMLRLTKKSFLKISGGQFKGQWVNLLNWEICLTVERESHLVIPKALKVLLWAIYMMKNGKTLPEGYSVLHAGKCMRCGRRLTDPTSIRTALGPECASKI
jgi:hypothetical protein